ncbi:hypothetical protein MANES_05G173100v8 [Manihot esculenta]|uniref:EF-hand domain-containing protein n=1 Tax=Manihot esculenta TaxID=3983 RepID=A0A2C9VX71_MANES|nr:hypothetical protein MANES_05G173100v8 [Manihot esculenta]
MTRKLSNKAASVEIKKDQLRKIFMQFDENHDNVLSSGEIKKAFKHLGATIPLYRAILGKKYADGNKDGVIDMNELDDLVEYTYKLQYEIN